MDYSVNLLIQSFEKYMKEERTETIKNKNYYINAEQQMSVPYSSMLHIPPINLLLLAAIQEPYKKACLLTKDIEEFSGKSLEERARYMPMPSLCLSAEDVWTTIMIYLVNCSAEQSTWLEPASASPSH